MSDNEKKRLDLVLNNIDSSFVEEYDFWKRFVSSINESIKIHYPDLVGFQYDEFCHAFKHELTNMSNLSIRIDSDTINRIIKQMIFYKISKKP